MSDHDEFSDDSDWNLTPSKPLSEPIINDPNASSPKSKLSSEPIKTDPNASSPKSKDTRRFRNKWYEIFAPWLGRCVEEPDKPFCKACRRRLDNNGFRLKRHEKTAKHVRNLELLITRGEAAVIELFNQRQKKKKYYKYRPAVKSKIKMESTSSSINPTQDVFEPKFSPKKRIIPMHEQIEQIDLDMYYKNFQHRDMNMSDYFYSKPQEKKDSFDMFFDAISATVKALPPKLAAETKSRVSQLLAEFELRAICEEEDREKTEQSIITTIPHQVGNVVTIDPITVSSEKRTDNGTAVTQYVYSYQPKI